MKKYTYITIAIIFIAISTVLLSCQHAAQATDIGNQVAGIVRSIDPNTIEAARRSAQAIGSAAEQITPEQEYFIGRAVAANILTRYNIWNGNPELTAYLNLICKAIVINSPRPNIFNGYRVAILDTNEINAFATSSGHIFLTRGLISVARSEDALAGVIAHEIAHIQLQHSIKAIRTSRITNALVITGTSVAGAITGYNVNELADVFNESVGEIVSTLVDSGYSQSQEFEADNIALSLLAAAGYNPSGLIDMLRELNNIQSSRPGGFNRTHPTPARRIRNAESSMRQHTVVDTSSYRQARFDALRIN